MSYKTELNNRIMEYENKIMKLNVEKNHALEELTILKHVRDTRLKEIQKIQRCVSETKQGWDHVCFDLKTRFNIEIAVATNEVKIRNSQKSYDEILRAINGYNKEIKLLKIIMEFAT